MRAGNAQVRAGVGCSQRRRPHLSHLSHSAYLCNGGRGACILHAHCMLCVRVPHATCRSHGERCAASHLMPLTSCSHACTLHACCRCGLPMWQPMTCLSLCSLSGAAPWWTLTAFTFESGCLSCDDYAERPIDRAGTCETVSWHNNNTAPRDAGAPGSTRGRGSWQHRFLENYIADDLPNSLHGAATLAAHPHTG